MLENLNISDSYKVTPDDRAVVIISEESWDVIKRVIEAAQNYRASYDHEGEPGASTENRRCDLYGVLDLVEEHANGPQAEPDIQDVFSGRKKSGKAPKLNKAKNPTAR